MTTNPNEEILSKLFTALLTVTTMAALYYAHGIKSDLARTKAALTESEDREIGIEAENDRLVEKMRGCEMVKDELEEIQSERTYLQLDYDRCKKDRDAAIKFGIQCLKQKIFSRNKK
jgi:hypothetical protein